MLFLQSAATTGTLLRDLRQKLAPSAQLVGLDYMASFLPDPLVDGNIRYVTGDACERPAADLFGAFDLTHVRFVLPGCGKAGADRVVSNLAGKELSSNSR